MGTYPAAICCHLTGKDGIPFSDQIQMKWEYPFLTQDFADREPEKTDSAKKENAEKKNAQKNNGAKFDTDEITQYIANFTDGSTAGYKYFDFETESTVAVLLRGRAHGTLKIAVNDENCETACGEIPVRIFTGEWTELKGEIRIPAGVHAVYFRYVGSGWVDFAVFEFVERK